MYYAEWFVLRWVICTMLKDLNYVEWSVQRWLICGTALNDLYYVEWVLLHWMICTTLNNFLLCCKICTTSNGLCSQGIIQHWKIFTTLTRSAMDDLYNVKSFGLRLIIIVFLMSARCAYSRKYCKYFALTSGLIFPWSGNIKNIRPSPRNWSYRYVFDHSIGKHKSDAPLSYMM